LESFICDKGAFSQLDYVGPATVLAEFVKESAGYSEQRAKLPYGVIGLN
jgi:hypothetical protein